MSNEWHYVQDGQQRGPVSARDLQALARNGTIGPDDLVWNASMTDWTPARQIRGLHAPAAAAPQHAPAPAPAPVAQPMHAPHPAPAQQGYAPPGGGVISYASPYGGDAGVSPQALELLRQTKPWARFIAVVLFVISGLMILVLLFLGFAAAGSRARGGPAGVLSLVYVLMTLLYLVPAVYLNQYASRIGDLLQRRSARDLEAALQAQKSFWKFVGIVTLVVICLYVLGIIIVLSYGASMLR